MAEVKDWRFARVITMVLLAAMTLLVMMAPMASASPARATAVVNDIDARNDEGPVPDWKYRVTEIAIRGR